MTEQFTSAEQVVAASPESRQEERDRVRRHTSAESLRHVDEMTRRNIRYYAAQPAAALDARIDELRGHWDMERVLETNATALALSGAVLGLTVNRKWFLLTCGVMACLAQHAAQGWCPPVPVLRRFGVRTQSELDQERYALKAVRGDFHSITSRESAASEALQAAQA